MAAREAPAQVGASRAHELELRSRVEALGELSRALAERVEVGRERPAGAERRPGETRDGEIARAGGAGGPSRGAGADEDRGQLEDDLGRQHRRAHVLGRLVAGKIRRL